MAGRVARKMPKTQGAGPPQPPALERSNLDANQTEIPTDDSNRVRGEAWNLDALGRRAAPFYDPEAHDATPEGLDRCRHFYYNASQ